VALLVFGAVTYAPPALAALNLTGTWTGTWKCKDVTNGAATKPGGTVTMTITQSGGDANASLQWTLKDGSPGGSETYQGHVQEVAAKPGQGATTLVGCETRPGSSVYAETLSANVKVTSSNATLKGISTYEQANNSIVGGTCKYSLKRTATADPVVAACPVVCPTPFTKCNCGTSGTFTDNCDGTVTDSATGLQWEKKTTAVGSGQNFADPHDVDNTYSWSATVGGTAADGTAYTDFLVKLNTPPCFAGHCDWRLPLEEGQNPPGTGAKELESILLAPYPCATSPCIDPIFGPTVADNYWSATTYSAFTVSAWFVYFNDGFVNNFVKKGFDYYVRAVRSGP
jgi:hypothetical protein